MRLFSKLSDRYVSQHVFNTYSVISGYVMRAATASQKVTAVDMPSNNEPVTPLRESLRVIL